MSELNYIPLKCFGPISKFVGWKNEVKHPKIADFEVFCIPGVKKLSKNYLKPIDRVDLQTPAIV